MTHKLIDTIRGGLHYIIEKKDLYICTSAIIMAIISVNFLRGDAGLFAYWSWLSEEDLAIAILHAASFIVLHVCVVLKIADFRKQVK